MSVKRRVDAWRPRCSRYSWSKTVRPRRRSCRTDSTSVTLAPARFVPRNRTRRSVLVPRRQVGHQVDPQDPAGNQHAARLAQRALEIGVGRERLQHPVRGHDRPKGGPGERERADVTEREARPRGYREPAGAPAGEGHHRARAIEPHDRDAGPRHRDGEPPGPAPQLEDRPPLAAGEVLPEAHVLPPHRPGVLPVVERRVVVPAVPAFAGRPRVRGVRRHRVRVRPRMIQGFWLWPNVRDSMPVKESPHHEHPVGSSIRPAHAAYDQFGHPRTAQADGAARHHLVRRRAPRPRALPDRRGQRGRRHRPAAARAASACSTARPRGTRPCAR